MKWDSKLGAIVAINVFLRLNIHVAQSNIYKHDFNLEKPKLEKKILRFF
jgi:hypothetical protein